MIEIVAIVLAAAIGIYFVARTRVDFFTAGVLLNTLPVLGAFSLAVAGKAKFDSAILMLLGLVALVCGFWFTTLFRKVTRNALPAKKSVPLSPSIGGQKISEASVWAVMIFVGLGVIWHFSIAGLPVLSSSVEVTRFDFTSSGLFGIPGRMVLFGTEISWIFISAFLTSRGVPWRSSTVWRWSTALLVGSSLVAGFKGGLAGTALTMSCTFFMFNKSSFSFAYVAKKFWWVIVSVIIYFFAIGSTYTTYKSRDLSLFEQLLERANTGSAEAGVIVLDGNFPKVGVNFFELDWSYFATKYFGGLTDGMFTFEQLISSTLYRTPLDSGYFVVPVTVGALPYLVAAFGPALALLSLFSLGVLMKKLLTSDFTNPYAMTAAAVGLLMCLDFLSKGSLVYTVLNHLAVIGVLLAVVFVSHFFSQRLTRKYLLASES